MVYYGVRRPTTYTRRAFEQALKLVVVLISNQDSNMLKKKIFQEFEYTLVHMKTMIDERFMNLGIILALGSKLLNRHSEGK